MAPNKGESRPGPSETAEGLSPDRDPAKETNDEDERTNCHNYRTETKPNVAQQETMPAISGFAKSIYHFV
jgi:hypothetical protein